jgi:hypothetical protein
MEESADRRERGQKRAQTEESVEEQGSKGEVTHRDGKRERGRKRAWTEESADGRECGQKRE